MVAMAQRQDDEQLEHDLVIQAAAEQFAGSAKYLIHTNPGTEKNSAVGHQHPDIIVTERGSSKVRFIIEVETINSVDASEVNHWRTLSGLGPPLYLVTPHLAMPVAQRLCSGAGIKCHHGYYLKDELGWLKVVLKKEPPLPTSGHGAWPH
jgi:metallophosphoesterase superfamily enzyme